MAGKKSRKQLERTFQQGAKPSGADFYDFIESIININDDGIERPAGTDQPLKITSKGRNGNLFDFHMGKQLTWRINQKPTGAKNPGLNFQTSDGKSKLFIENASGNVGIGTLTPGNKLEVNGTAHIKGDMTAGGKINFGTQGGQMLNLYNTNYGFGIQTNTQYYRTGAYFAWYRGGCHTNGELNPGKGGTALMVIKGYNVGIGTTAPQYKLEVNGDIGYSGKLNHLDVAEGSSAFVRVHDFCIGSSAPERHGKTGRALVDLKNTLVLNYGNDWSNGVQTGKLTVDSICYLPKLGQLLNLWKSNYGIGMQQNTQYFRTDFNFAWYKGGSHNNGQLNPGGGTPLMVITGDNVGIGTTSPKHRLDVNGSAHFTGDPHIDGSIYFKPVNRQMLNLWRGELGIGIQNNTHYFRTSGNFAFYKGGVHDNGELKPGKGGKALLEIKDDQNGNSTTINVPGKRMHITGGEKLYLLNKGGVLITNDWNKTGGNLAVSGTISHGGKLTKYSSRKLKENISSFTVKEALKLFKQLNPVKFNMKNDEKKELCLGFIAEDTPGPVATEKKDAIIFNHIVTLLTKVVQDQQSKISELQEKMNAINVKAAN